LRGDAVLKKSRKLVIVFLSLTLITAMTTVAAAYVDIIAIYSDAAHTQPETTFDDGDRVYVTVTNNKTTGGTKTITVANEVEGNRITVSVTEGATSTVYEGSFVIHSGADGVETLHMEHGQTGLIEANLDSDDIYGWARITADYGITPLLDNVWIYSDSSYIVQETEFGHNETVYVKVTDTETKGGTKEITVKNNQKLNEIHINITDSNSDSFYLGSFVVYSGANDDANDKLALFYGESATITADLANDGFSGTAIIYFRAISSPTNLTAAAIAGGSIRLTWTASSPETNVAQYNIYRATTSGEQNYASPLTNVSAGTTTYTDSATTDGITYYYVVRAQDSAGNMETNTNEAIATADATSPPSPSNLQAAPISDDGIELTWTASSLETDVSQYNIYRATSSGGQNYSSPTYTVSVGITSYTDSGATPGQTYYYVVRAQDAAGNTDTNTNEVWATAGFASTLSDIYIKYQGTILYDLTSSTNRNNPTVFAKGKIDEIYLKVNLLAGVPLDESGSNIALYKLVEGETEEASGSQAVSQDTGWAELVFHLSPVFDPDVDEHGRDGLYWVNATVVDTAGNSEDFDFYFIYDTTSPSVPDFQITSYEPTTGSITVSGTTVPDESDPQEVEIFVNDLSKGTATADANYQFVKSGIGLARGTNYIKVQSMDKAGNKSKLSKTLKFAHNPEGLLSVVFRSTHVVRRDSPIGIIYSVTQVAEIVIRVYNLNGALVKEWQGNASPGVANEWKWYGKNMYEEEVNNGVYICRITASNGSRESKIKLLAVLR